MTTKLLTEPLRDIPAWADYLSRIEIPVLPETIEALARLAGDEDNVDAQAISEVVMRDPLMTVKVYRHVAALRRRSQITDVESITGSLLMLGVSPFFRQFGALTALGPPSGHTHRWKLGLLAVMHRAQRASDYAFEWAARRNDLDAETIGTAALLHDFTEMLLWSAAPALASTVDTMLAQNPGMRSLEAQQAVLNVGINDLQHELMQRWHLPELLVRITDDHAAGDVQVKNVMLAVALARHSAHGWHNPALPDDYTALGELLHISATQARHLVAREHPPG